MARNDRNQRWQTLSHLELICLVGLIITSLFWENFCAGSVFTHPAHASSPLPIAARAEDGEEDLTWWLPYLAHLDHALRSLLCV